MTRLTVALARFDSAIDELGVNAGFDAGCDGLRGAGRGLSWLQNGRVQRYMRIAGVAFSVLALALIWGCG